MTDWREKTRRKLLDSKLTREEREEISRELAGYLEDLCADAPSRGVDELTAAQRAAAELAEDKHLGAHIHRARKESDIMNDRTRQLWLPGLGVLLIMEAMLYLAQFSRFEVLFWIGQSHRWRVAINLPFLCVLPLLGAMSVYWSRRKGAARPMQVAAGLFPLLFFIGSFIGGFFGGSGVAALPVRIAFGEHPWGLYQLMVMHLPWILLGWVCIPVAALLLGMLPVLGLSKPLSGRASDA